jgi:hypothetical protein
MGNGPDGGLITQSRQQSPEHALEETAFLHDGSMRCLVQYSPQIFNTLRGTTAAVLLRTFLLAGKGSDANSKSQLPKCKMLRGRPLSNAAYDTIWQI